MLFKLLFQQLSSFLFKSSFDFIFGFSLWKVIIDGCSKVIFNLIGLKYRAVRNLFGLNRITSSEFFFKLKEVISLSLNSFKRRNVIRIFRNLLTTRTNVLNKYISRVSLSINSSSCRILHNKFLICGLNRHVPIRVFTHNFNLFSNWASIYRDGNRRFFNLILQVCWSFAIKPFFIDVLRINQNVLMLDLNLLVDCFFNNLRSRSKSRLI